MRFHHEAEGAFKQASAETKHAAEPVLELLAPGFQVTWFREIERLIWMAVVKPSEEVGTQFELKGEYLVIGNGHSKDFHQRTLKNKPPPDVCDRLDSAIMFVHSDAPVAAAFCAAWAQKTKSSVVLIKDPKSKSQNAEKELFRMLSSSLWRRDFFADSEPVRDPSEFFGRDLAVTEVFSKILLGSPLAIFGLRKIGKTSLLKRVQDLLEAETSSVSAVAFIVGNSTKLKSGRWWTLATEVLSAWQHSLQTLAKLKDEKISVKAERLAELIAKNVFDNALLATAFERDVQSILRTARTIASRLDRDGARLVLILDECDHLYPHTLGCGRWREDFFMFWNELQAIKRRLDDTSELVFLISGVNPSGVERGELEGHPNPLYELEKLYLPPMEEDEAGSMLTGLGSRMGLYFDESALEKAYELVGGHPLLLRRMGSAIHVAHKDRSSRTKIDGRQVENTYSKRKKNFYNQVIWILEHLARVAPDEEKLLRDVATGGAQGYSEYWGDNDFRETYAYHLEMYGLLVFTNDLPEISLPIIRDALKAPVATDFNEQKKQLKQLVEEIEAAVRSRLCTDIWKEFSDQSVILVVNAIPGDAKNRALDREALKDLGAQAGIEAVLDNLNWGDYELLFAKFYDQINWIGEEMDKNARLSLLRELFTDSHLVRHNNDHGLKLLIDREGFDPLIKHFWTVREMLSA